MGFLKSFKMEYIVFRHIRYFRTISLMLICPALILYIEMISLKMKVFAAYSSLIKSVSVLKLHFWNQKGIFGCHYLSYFLPNLLQIHWVFSEDPLIILLASLLLKPLFCQILDFIWVEFVRILAWCQL